MLLSYLKCWFPPSMILHFEKNTLQISLAINNLLHPMISPVSVFALNCDCNNTERSVPSGIIFAFALGTSGSAEGRNNRAVLVFSIFKEISYTRQTREWFSLALFCNCEVLLAHPQQTMGRLREDVPPSPASSLRGDSSSIPRSVSLDQGCQTCFIKGDK